MAFSTQWEQSETVAVDIDRNQTAILKLLAMIFENTQQSMPDDFWSWAIYTELNDTWQPRSPQSKNPGEIQILSYDNSTVITGVIKQRFVWISCVTNFAPMGCIDVECGQKMLPAGRQIFIDQKNHEASSSWVSDEAISAANARAARMDSTVRYG